MEAAGGQEAALLPGEQRAGRGGGLRSPPPPTEACSRRLRRKVVGSTSLSQAWVGGIRCSFVPGREKAGRRFLLPCCSPRLRLLSASHCPPRPSRNFADALRAGEFKEWTVKKTAKQSSPNSEPVCGLISDSVKTTAFST